MIGTVPMLVALTAAGSVQRNAAPTITEILYAVPRDAADSSVGDANLDGSRDATGDEFIELTNATDRPIELGGWRLTDLHPDPDGGEPSFSFTFPPMRLPPGKTVVVFNGREQAFEGPHGNAGSAPRAVDTRFDGAAVFTAGNSSARRGLSNSGDGVALLDPRGRAHAWVTWGECDRPAPEGCGVVARAPVTSAGSVVPGPTPGDWIEHPPVLTADPPPGSTALRYSPGDADNGGPREADGASPDPFGTDR